MAYALKLDGKVIPLTGMIDPQAAAARRRQHDHVRAEPPAARRAVQALLHGRLAGSRRRCRSSSCSAACRWCRRRQAITYDNIFRVIIMQFLDAHNFDVRSVKKTCVHIVHPDGRIIPFDTFNLFYRDEKEQKLAELRVGGRPLVTLG